MSKLNLHPQQLKHIHFPNLDALRGIAAGVVVLSHIELLKPNFNLKTLRFNSLLTTGGSIAVTLFFVLSGFLITYLLMNEKEKKQKIFLKEFYIRRTLRLWPLFYLTLFICYIIVPKFFPSFSANAGWFSFFLNALFLTNLTYVIKLLPPLGTAVWSIGIEEQFYIFWPLVLKKTKVHSLMKLLVGIIFAIYMLKAALVYFSSYNAFIHKMRILVNITRYDCLLVGAVGALLYKGCIIKIGRLQINYSFFTSFAAQLILYSLLFISILANSFYHVLIIHQWYSFLFMPMILNMAANEKSIVKIDNAILNYLGKISYSMYLLHMFVIAAILKFLIPYWQNKDLITQNVIIYSLVIFSTIIVSSGSYYLIEKPFFRLKEKFQAP